MLNLIGPLSASQSISLRSLQSFRTQIVRFRAQIALKRTFRPPLHRPPYRSNTDTAPRTPLLGTLVRLRRTRVGHALGPNARPYAPAQSAGTGSIYKHGLSLHAPAQSTGRGLNLQARFERRMLFRTPCGISGLALDPTWNSGLRTFTRVPRTCRTDWLSYCTGWPPPLCILHGASEHSPGPGYRT